MATNAWVQQPYVSSLNPRPFWNATGARPGNLINNSDLTIFVTLIEAGGSSNLEGESPSVTAAQVIRGVNFKVEGQVKTPVTLRRYELFSPASSGSCDEARLKVCLARLQIEERKEKAQVRQAQLDCQLQVKRLEIEERKAVRLRQREFDSQGEAHTPEASSMSAPSISAGLSAFDISKQIALVPIFRETEVDSHFCAFEHIATALHRPPDVWALLLQCKIQSSRGIISTPSRG